MSVVHINSVTSQGERSNDTIISTDALLKHLIWEEFQHRSFYCSQVDPVLSKRTFCSTKLLLLLFETLNCDGSRLKKQQPEKSFKFHRGNSCSISLKSNPTISIWKFPNPRVSFSQLGYLQHWKKKNCKQTSNSGFSEALHSGLHPEVRVL